MRLCRAYCQHSEAVYIIAGATHPHIKRREGDQYRLQLQALARKLGVDRNVIFHNRFVSPEEMAQFVGSADIYITPYRHEAQAVSGTLAYALGAGKAIISTPYWHAAELLDDGRGMLVPFGDSTAIADAAIDLLDHEAAGTPCANELTSMRVTWSGARPPSLICRLLYAPARTACEHRAWPRRLNAERALDRLPAIKLDHLQRMTDHTGMLQHAVFSVPNYREGYTTDDNARALIAAVLMEQLGLRWAPNQPSWHRAIWLSFGMHSILRPAASETFLSYDRQWHEAEGSEDSHGRALWGLGTVLGRSKFQGCGALRGGFWKHCSRGSELYESTGMGLRPARNAGVSRLVSRRQSYS